MKTILTLFFSVLLYSAFAQTDAQRDEARRIILGDRRGSDNGSKEGRDVILGSDDRMVYGGRTDRYPDRYPTYNTSREQRVYEINRDYDAKIYSIRTNPRLSRYEKERIIRQLEAERRRALAAINDRYDGRRNRYDDTNYKKSKGCKSNNGNHYGWEQGNGNRHRGK